MRDRSGEGGGGGAWSDRAACRDAVERGDADPEDWFASEATAVGAAAVERAVEVCWDECPVRAECLEWALAEGEGSGVWGGVPESKRRSIRRGRQRKRRLAS